jgi:hypothetical protein
MTSWLVIRSVADTANMSSDFMHWGEVSNARYAASVLLRKTISGSAASRYCLHAFPSSEILHNLLHKVLCAVSQTCILHLPSGDYYWGTPVGFRHSNLYQ